MRSRCPYDDCVKVGMEEEGSRRKGRSNEGFSLLHMGAMVEKVVVIVVPLPVVVVRWEKGEKAEAEE